jgi:hypothetical protein
MRWSRQLPCALTGPFRRHVCWLLHCGSIGAPTITCTLALMPSVKFHGPQFELRRCLRLAHKCVIPCPTTRHAQVLQVLQDTAQLVLHELNESGGGGGGGRSSNGRQAAQHKPLVCAGKEHACIFRLVAQIHTEVESCHASEAAGCQLSALWTTFISSLAALVQACHSRVCSRLALKSNVLQPVVLLEYATVR